MKKLLITGAWKYTQQQYDTIEQMGYDICFVQNEQDELPQEAYEAEVIICNGLFLHHSIEKFTKLKVIQLTSAGFDRVPMDYIKVHEIKINNARGVYSIPMAEFVLCGVLDFYKKSHFFYDNQKQRNWIKSREIFELFDKNVLIVGAGNVGSECAKRFAAFGTHVRGVDLYPRVDEGYEKIVSLAELQSELSIADIVVLTLPLTDETRHLFNDNVFGAMKTGVVLANIARGAVIEKAALINALSSGKVGAAILDVFEEEPLCETSPLWSMDNVIITPHNSFVGDGNNTRLWNVIKKNMESAR